MTYERATGPDAESGWTIKPSLLTAIQDDIADRSGDGDAWCPCMEEIEQVLLALERRAEKETPADEQQRNSEWDRQRERIAPKKRRKTRCSHGVSELNHCNTCD